jgi:hypothetical protein
LPKWVLVKYEGPAGDNSPATALRARVQVEADYLPERPMDVSAVACCVHWSPHQQDVHLFIVDEKFQRSKPNTGPRGDSCRLFVCA